MKLFENASKPRAEYYDWDPRYPEVVRALVSEVGQLPAGVAFEHVGSTAIPGCGGKGVIDLLALYAEGALEETKRWLLSLGLARQGSEFARAWPETRPMYLGWYRHQCERFMVYVHVVRSSSDEVRRFRDFRGLLGGSPELVAEYCRLKRQILSGGVTDTDEYAAQKRAFFRTALGATHVLLEQDAEQQAFPHLDDLRRAYDRDASQRTTFDDLQWRPDVLEAWLRELPRSPKLLELGPGAGQLALCAVKLGARVHAIDLSPQNVSYCRQRGISAQVGDIRTIREIDGLGLFDGVYAINVLLHVPRAEQAAVVAGVRERLVPGGRLLLVNWGGRDVEGIWAEDRCEPARFFSQYSHPAFETLAFDGFEVVRREVLPDQAPDGMQPQLLSLRRLPVGEACP
jgi:GrpB-like predicted nucleotidyltransferase (UPF0157 family)/SAM-dependent methyltransferase